MVKSRSTAANGLLRVEEEQLPLAIKTLTVNGRHMTLPFYRQIIEEDLVDEETGELRGTPLGFVHLHQKENCPHCPHRHILWMGEQGLRSAVVVAPEDANRYAELQAESEQIQHQLNDLLGLVLVREHRTPELTGFFEGSWSRREVVIAGESLSISPNACQLLVRLEQARTCLEQEQQRLGLHASDSPGPTSQAEAQELADARLVQQELVEQGILLAHPQLYQHPEGEGEHAPIHLNMRPLGAKREVRHTRRVQDLWLIYADPTQADDRRSWLLFWRSTHHATDQASDEESAAIEARIGPHVPALRVLLAEKTVPLDLLAVAEYANSLAKVLNLPATEGSGPVALPEPDAVRAALEERRVQFVEYTQRWRQSLAELGPIVQLYIVPGERR